MNVRALVQQVLCVCVLSLFVGMPRSLFGANPANGLRIEITASPNFIVDSNVESPSTYAPKSAFIGATFYNDGTNDLTDVFANIGNYGDGTYSAPGVYPARTNPAPLTGTFSLTHQGGSAGTSDATRYLGTLKPGQSVSVYWLVTYPVLDSNNKPVFGVANDYLDDLWLYYDVWARANRGGSTLTANRRQTVTMRSEISAMANKIYPNTANSVPDKYKALLNQYAPQWDMQKVTGTPGEILSMEGFWFDLGTVGGGYDVNGDLVPDMDSWLQPVGDASLFDAGCMRLVRTYTLLIVSLKSGGEQVFSDLDKLYYTGLPENNGIVGYVRYDFLALTPGSVRLTPYQEAASGNNNEKFNGDYGSTAVPTISATTSKVTMAKSTSMTEIAPGQTNRYTIAFTNAGNVGVGNPALGMSLVVQDHLPAGVQYVAGSAGSSNLAPTGATGFTVLYSTNNGVAWLNTEPLAATNVTDLQWWLSDALATGAVGAVSFAARVSSPWLISSPVIVNTGKLSFGNSTPFMQSTAATMVLGTNSLGDKVFLDNGVGVGGYFGNKLQDGAEPGLSNILVSLYWDGNTNGTYDSSDTYLRQAFSRTDGGYLFTNLADAKYVVAVNTSSNVPVGYTATTPAYYAVDLDSTNGVAGTVSATNCDFGFAPALYTAKALTSSTNVVEGRLVTYSLIVSNALPGSGTGQGVNRSYTAWATKFGSATAGWLNPSNATHSSEPDIQYSTNFFDKNTTDDLIVRDFSPGLQSGSNINVKIAIPLLINSYSGDKDSFVVTLKNGSGTIVTSTPSLYITNLANGTLLLDITAATNNWAFLADTNTSVTVTTTKSGGAAGEFVAIDSIGMRIMTDQIEGTSSSSSTLDPVPLLDAFSANALQYVSATTVPTTITTNGGVGSLYWQNLGPLYPGGGKQITVTFKALEPFNVTSNTAAVITNSEIVTNATFVSGRSAGSFINVVTNWVQPAGVIGDFIWRDLNTNGVQDVGEPGIAGIKVVLTPPAGVDAGAGTGISVTNTTDSNGGYLFEGIPASGSYTIRVLTNTLPSVQSTCTYDADGVKDSVVTTNFNPLVSNGQDKLLGIDFGYKLSSTLEGTIWWDFNQSSNAVRDSGELWLTNVTVRLYTNSTTLLATTNTDSNGYFVFSGSYEGAYQLVVVTNSGMMSAGTWGMTYDTDGGSASTVTVTVVSGGTARGDFSYVNTGALTLGDTVFYDWDGNGSQTNSEEGIPNIPVYLYGDVNGNGVLDVGTDPYIRATTTSVNGAYSFGGLASGNYLVVVDQANSNFPALATCTADPQTPKDGVGYLALAASTATEDFGFQPYGNGEIGDVVWRDLNGDGVQSGIQETGITNVPVRLFVDANKDGVFVLLTTTNTDSLGQYRFANLADASYRVSVDTTSSNIPRDSLNVAYGATTLTTRDITIVAGSSDLSADFGFAPYGAIGDAIFWDANTNGLQDAFESGISGVQVRLYHDVDGNGVLSDGDTLATNCTTDASGLYLFSNLTTGRYVVAVVTTNGILANAVLSADPEADGAPVSSVTNATAHDAATGVRINYGSLFMGADFGFKPPSAIGDSVWIDSNTNGLYDAGEAGIPNVPVVVYSNATAIATNRTDSDGHYGFGNLLDGLYTVKG